MYIFLFITFPVWENNKKCDEDAVRDICPSAIEISFQIKWITTKNNEPR